MGFVQRCEDDVEAFEHRYRGSRGCHLPDVDFAAVEHGNLGQVLRMFAISSACGATPSTVRLREAAELGE